MRRYNVAGPRYTSYPTVPEWKQDFGTERYAERLDVAGSAGAEFHPDLARAVEHAHLIVRKGYNPGIDSYSAFFENDKVTATGLAASRELPTSKRICSP